VVSNESLVYSPTPGFFFFVTFSKAIMADPRIEISGEDNEVEMSIPVDVTTAPNGNPAADAGNGEQEAPAVKSQQGTFVE
jgi:hypothetical protein